MTKSGVADAQAEFVAPDRSRFFACPPLRSAGSCMPALHANGHGSPQLQIVRAGCITSMTQTV
eukprot:7546234-Pyramimonas_sp.AAC.1